MSRESKASKDEIQRNRQAAYQVGWGDGYAEGYEKAVTDLIAAFPTQTAYGRGVRCAIIRAAALAAHEQGSGKEA
jgi:hypothetical protein